jgi:rare lipoprotein A
MARTNRSLYWPVCLLLVVGCGPMLRQPHPGNTNTGARTHEGERAAPATGTDPFALDSLDRAETVRSKPYQVGVASYYGRQFHGRTTANGERFNMYKLTAAHRALPLGTLLRVTNLRNGRCVRVKVNDRGPYVKGRVLDVSYQAARDLGMVRDGTTKVKIDILMDAGRNAPIRSELEDESVGGCVGHSPSS